MRPLTLHLQYFGPYRDEEIDFQKFDNPLFLISGKTGSGKTTIFDGMCYALFDQSSGVDREPTAMRSDFATTEDHTRVTFTFSHRNRDYRIIREPAQTLKKKRGAGVTNAPASVELTVFENGTETKQLTKANQVRPFLQDLLQMDGKQFAQIVLLPQGKFRQFLVAPSDEKAAVLEQLFSTEIFGLWADQLKAQLRTEQDKNKETDRDREQVQSSLIWTPENREAAETAIAQAQTDTVLTLMANQQTATQAAETAAKDQVATANKQVTALTQQDTREEQLLKDQKELEKQIQRQQQLKAQEPEIRARRIASQQLERVQAIQPQWTTRASAQRDLAQRKAAAEKSVLDLTAKQTKLQQAQANQKAATKIETRLTETKANMTARAKLMPIYEKVADLTKQLKAAQTASKQAETTEAELTKNGQQTQVQLKQQLAITGTQAEHYQEQQRLSKREAELNDWQRQVRGIQDADQEIATTEKKVATAKSSLDQAQHEYAESQARFEELNQELLEHQIVQLAAQLKPGRPCPVCGSVDHPHPVVVTDSAVTEAEVKVARQHAEDCHIQVTRLDTKLKTLVATLADQQKSRETDVTKLIAAVSTTDDELNTFADCQQRVTDLVATYRAAVAKNERALAEVKKAQTQVTRLQRDAEQLEQMIKDAQKARQVKVTAADHLEVQVTTQREALPEDAPTLTEFKAQDRQLKQQLDADQKRWDDCVQAVKTATDAVTVATTERDGAAKEHTASQQRLTTAQADLAAAIAAQGSELTALAEDAIAELLPQVATLPRLRQQLADFQQQQAQVKTSITDLKKRVADRPQPNREQTRNDLHDAQQRVTALLDQQHQLTDRWQTNDRYVKQLKKLVAQQAAAVQKTQALNELVGVTNGDGPNSKLGLERYVLQTYLRQILQVGNQRLQQLTNGRYQFLVDESPATYKKKSGLEINVYDDHVGEQRSVHTLSGGESFIAALALALALGEVIQRTTGSVDVEALFIDEGFGSLDEDALMTALNSLESVEGQNRMIGIISHVSELREQVPNQLQVVSNGNGESQITYQIED
ncbi:DNA repair ATPase [Levilactobacillus paucivorans]|uniref:Nuclease SbcCD subunit C n=1 Tax=Levilactobacillus paucivorans TaxID=616990 RepID=A0A0R2LPK3_9LACO|nr:SMC family ATPase [Levilactobacillus paucivorans]KRO03701.1 DNA repair ATPase [Levilactobacillus paucivorans]